MTTTTNTEKAVLISTSMKVMKELCLDASILFDEERGFGASRRACWTPHVSIQNRLKIETARNLDHNGLDSSSYQINDSKQSTDPIAKTQLQVMGNPILPRILSNTIAVHCITRTTVVMENPSFAVSPNNSKENSNPHGKQDDSPPNNSNEEELRIQFQSSSGPPKKRLSPKWGLTIHGGKFEETVSAMKKSNSTDCTNDPKQAPKPTKPSTRPSQSFDKARKNLRVAKKAFENTNSEHQHGLVNAVLNASHPPDVYYKHNDHQKHIGLNVQFVDNGVPCSDEPVENSKPKRLYKFGLPELQETASSVPKYGYLPHFASQYFLTPEVWHELMTGPLIRTPEALYYRACGPQSPTANQVPIPSTSQPPTSSADPHSFACQASIPSATQSPICSAPPQSFANQVPIPHTTHPPTSSAPTQSFAGQGSISHTTQPPTSPVGPTVLCAQPVASTDPPGKSASMLQIRYHRSNYQTPMKAVQKTPKKANLKPVSAHTFIYTPLVTTKPCKCSKTKCLKLYCKCFETGRLCATGFCGCKGCKNLKEYLHKDSDRAIAIKETLKRKSTAFQPKS